MAVARNRAIEMTFAGADIWGDVDGHRARHPAIEMTMA